MVGMASKVDVHEIILAAGVPREGKSVLEKKSVMADVSDLTVVIDTTRLPVAMTVKVHARKRQCMHSPMTDCTDAYKLYSRPYARLQDLSHMFGLR